MALKRILILVSVFWMLHSSLASTKTLTLCFNRSVKLTSSYTSNTTTVTSYNWTFDGAIPGSGGGTSDSVTNGITFPSPRTYTIVCDKRISDGSSLKDTFLINALEYRIQPFSFKDTTVCGNIGLNIGFAQGGTNMRYAWKPGNQTTQNIVINGAGNYTGSIYSIDGYTAQGFGVCDSASSSFTVVQGQAADVELGVNRIICASEPITLDAGPGYKSYLWGPGGQTTQTISVSKSGVYTIAVENNDGCKDNDIIAVRDSCPMYIWIPNSFTPVVNGLNDVFIWKGNMQMERYEMRIYNRWGEKLFETKDPLKGWDGTFKNKYVPEGVYAYWIYVIDSNGNKHRLKGDLTVLVD